MNKMFNAMGDVIIRIEWTTPHKAGQAGPKPEIKSETKLEAKPEAKLEAKAPDIANTLSKLRTRPQDLDISLFVEKLWVQIKDCITRGGHTTDIKLTRDWFNKWDDNLQKIAGYPANINYLSYDFWHWLRGMLFELTPEIEKELLQACFKLAPLPPAEPRGEPGKGPTPPPLTYGYAPAYCTNRLLPYWDGQYCVECMDDWNCVPGFSKCFNGKCVKKESPQCALFPGVLGGSIVVERYGFKR